MKGDTVVAFCDRNCNVIAPFVSAPGNRNESPLLKAALPQVTRIAKQVGLDLRANHRQPRWGLRQSGEPESYFQSRDGAEYSRKSARQQDDEA